MLANGHSDRSGLRPCVGARCALQGAAVLLQLVLPWSEAEVQEAVRLARAAVEAGRDDPVALAHSSGVLAYFGADYDLAISLAGRAAVLKSEFGRG